LARAFPWPDGSPAQIISPYHLYLNPKLVVQQYEIWRLVTNFLYFRKMGMRSISFIP
jgi:Derlin-2/3